MLVLTLRAPPTARAFSFNSAFFSAEYPEFVCTSFNDQFIALVDTPSGAPSPIPNPSHKNLMTFEVQGEAWPVNAQAAHGTKLFSICKPNGGAADHCWDDAVSTHSCSQGESLLASTGFDRSNPKHCNVGGGTRWLTTTGDVLPGELVQIRIALWDAGDGQVDSVALLDGFTWLQAPATPGTR